MSLDRYVKGAELRGLSYNPWEGQGSTQSQTGGMSTPDDAPGGGVDWGGVIRTGVENLDDILAVLLGKSKSPAPKPQGNQKEPSEPAKKGISTTWILAGGALLVVILLLVFVLKK